MKTKIGILTPARRAAATRFLCKADPKLASVIRAWGPCGLEPDDLASPYQALVRSIVYQQLTGKAAGTILGRVKELYGHGGIPEPRELLETPDEKLRTAGLSRGKTAALKDLASKALEGTVPTHDEIVGLPDEQIVERLCQIRGIGPWTVEMMLMFKLGRADVLPATDYGVRAGFAIVYGCEELPAPKEILEHGERWKPYRSVAAWYMWRAVDGARERRKAESEKQEKSRSKSRESGATSALARIKAARPRKK